MVLESDHLPQSPRPANRASDMGCFLLIPVTLNKYFTHRMFIILIIHHFDQRTGALPVTCNSDVHIGQMFEYFGGLKSI
jgi:hypothetical protein